MKMQFTQPTPIDAPLVQQDGRGEIVVADPFAPGKFHADPADIIKAMHERQRERRADFDALGDVATAPLDSIKGVLTATEADDDALLAYEKAVREALLDLSGFKTIIVQMKGAKTRIDPRSVRGVFADIIKACRKRIDAEKPPKPKHTYCVRLTCDDDTLAAVLKCAAKYGAEDICYATAQSDTAVENINNWFKENA